MREKAIEWVCVCPFLSVHGVARLLSVCREAREAARRELAARWVWEREGQDPVLLWGRLMTQKWERRCMRCGEAPGLHLAVVCSCVSPFWRGCVRYHIGCCESRPVRRNCVVTLARCWLCGSWVMALRTDRAARGGGMR